MTRTITPTATLEQRLAALKEGRDLDEQVEIDDRDKASTYRYVRPLSASYDGVVAALENNDDRFRLGLPQLDVLTRGFGPKELVIVSGFSHEGKSQIVLNAVLNNPDKRILLFSMDDPTEMILVKLACMHAGVSAEDLERRIRAHDEQAKKLLHGAAATTFRNLIVVDDSLGFTGMNKALAEARDFWGAEPDLIAIDYLELLQGDAHSDDASATVKAKSQSLKRWCKELPCPLLVVHQNTRSRGAPGVAPTMLSMAYGGEQEATFVLGVYRKRNDEGRDQWERQQHENTVSVVVAKNKRPPAKRTPPDGVDFWLDPQTGVIRTLRDEDVGFPKVSA